MTYLYFLIFLFIQQPNGNKIKIDPISYVLKPKGLYLYCFDSEYHLIPVKSIKDTKPTTSTFTRDFIPYKKNEKINR